MRNLKLLKVVSIVLLIISSWMLLTDLWKFRNYLRKAGVFGENLQEILYSIEEKTVDIDKLSKIEKDKLEKSLTEIREIRIQGGYISEDSSKYDSKDILLFLTFFSSLITTISTVSLEHKRESRELKSNRLKMQKEILEIEEKRLELERKKIELQEKEIQLKKLRKETEDLDNQ